MNNPYSFQSKVSKLLLDQKRSLILQAPTGAGKTRAALEPGILGFHRSDQTNDPINPSRIIYGVPMRVLARSFQKEYFEIAQGLKGNMPWQSEWQWSRVNQSWLGSTTLFQHLWW